MVHSTLKMNSNQSSHAGSVKNSTCVTDDNKDECAALWHIWTTQILRSVHDAKFWHNWTNQNLEFQHITTTQIPRSAHDTKFRNNWSTQRQPEDISRDIATLQVRMFDRIVAKLVSNAGFWLQRRKCVGVSSTWRQPGHSLSCSFLVGASRYRRVSKGSRSCTSLRW